MAHAIIVSMEKKVSKIYPIRGELSKKYTVTTFEVSSPWKSANVAFTWLNFDYPQIHGHTDWEFFLVLQDEMMQEINDTTDLMTAGVGCLLTKNDKHALVFAKKSKNFQGVNILVRDSYMRDFLNVYSPSLYDELCEHKRPLYFSVSKSSLEYYQNLLLAAQIEKDPQIRENYCKIVFNYLILKVIEENNSPYHIPNELFSFVQTLNNPYISPELIQEAKDALPYSYSQLTRVFNKYMHCTITQYINQVKMNHAKELLSGTDMTIYQITEELRFKSEAHFYTLFKKMFGITPLNYRKQNLN